MHEKPQRRVHSTPEELTLDSPFNRQYSVQTYLPTDLPQPVALLTQSADPSKSDSLSRRLLAR